MDRVAIDKGVIIPQGANKSDYINTVLGGSTNLTISFITEMNPCSSCTNIINRFNNVNSNNIIYQSGTNFYG